MLMDNKKKIIVSLILVILIVTVVLETKDDSSAEEVKDVKKNVVVTAKSAADSKTAGGTMTYPATVIGDQEVRITAGAGGTATAVNFDLGDKVGTGQLLVKIDDQNGSAGDSGFQSGQMKQLEKAVEIAKESYDLAKENYEDAKSDATKSARDIAKLQLENAMLGLESAKSGRLVKAPISGTVSGRSVTAGDSVSPGQLLATISKTNKLKVQFYMDKEELSAVKSGMKVEIRSGEMKFPAKITNVAPQADSATRRFLVEAVPEGNNDLTPGTIVTVGVEIRKSTNGDGVFFLPLSSVNITQNEKFVFILDGETARKRPVEIVKVSGETAEVKADFSDDTLIVFEGNKMISDDEKVEVK